MGDRGERPARSWAGIPLAERAATRRAELIDVAFDLFGTEGEAACSIRAVCRRAGLNPRYFYESFASIEELLAAVYDDQLAKLVAIVLSSLDWSAEESERTRAALAAALAFVTEDPRRSAILFTEGLTIPPLAERRSAARRLLIAQSDASSGHDSTGDDLQARVLAVMTAGAMQEVVRSWADGELGTDLTAVIDLTVHLSTALFDAGRPPP